MELLEALGKAGILVLLGVLITAFYGRANSKDTYKIALRKLENEEDAEAKKEKADLRDRERKLHDEEIEFLKLQIANAEARAAKLESDLAKAAHGKEKEGKS